MRDCSAFALVTEGSVAGAIAGFMLGATRGVWRSESIIRG